MKHPFRANGISHIGIWGGGEGEAAAEKKCCSLLLTREVGLDVSPSGAWRKEMGGGEGYSGIAVVVSPGTLASLQYLGGARRNFIDQTDIAIACIKLCQAP